VGIALIAAAAVVAVRVHRASASHAAAALTADTCPADAKKANFNFTLPDVHGNIVKLSDFSGKVVLLDFWATWCVPCQVELPGFIDLREKYKSRGFEVLGMVVMDEFKNAKPYADAHGMTYPILDAVDRPDVEAAFGPLMGLPTSFVISRDGRICAAHLGVPDIRTPAPTLQQSIQNVFDAEIRPLL
jgi:peroxiredoxin